MRKKYLCILICLFANALAFASAANRTITGVVISGEDNEPLIGASVYVNADDLKKAGASQTSPCGGGYHDSSRSRSAA